MSDSFYDPTFGFGNAATQPVSDPYATDMSGFMDPYFGYAPYVQPGSIDYSNIGGNYLDIGDVGGQAYSPSSFYPVSDFGQGSDIGLTSTIGNEDIYTDDGYDVLGTLGRLGSGALNAITSDPRGLLSMLGGAATFYGNLRGQRDERDLAEEGLGIKRDTLELARDQQGVSDLDQMARTAMGMGILANRGRLSPDQSNPWLNFMFTGRQGLYGEDDQFGKAYAANPFGASPLGAAIVQAPKEFLNSAPGVGQPRPNRMVGFAEGGAVPRMGMRARLNQMRQDRGMQPTGKVGALQISQGLQAPQQNMMGNYAPQMQNMMGRLQGMFGGAQSGMNAIPGSPEMQRLAQAVQEMPNDAWSGTLQNMVGKMQETYGNNQQQAAPQNLMGMYNGAQSGMQAGAPAGGMRARLEQMQQQRGMNQGMSGALGGAMGALRNGTANNMYGMQAGAQAGFDEWARRQQEQARKQPSVDPAFHAYAGGGLAQLGYLAGGSGGQDDNVNANLSHGEYVVDADTVAALGDGNNEAGAKKLDVMRTKIRKHKRSAPASKIPPKAKDPMAYLGRK